REALVFPSDWAASRCGGLRVLVVAGQEDYTLCYPDERGFTLFFEFPGREPAPAGGPPAEACAFLETFVWRFQILLGLIGAGREPPFPAILQVPG
ncbi:MAG: hypothetical protein JW820_15625, partial [Spirochaetales bacterium]|nr:hypothetical protein [Spirochaetales bacterium]